MLTQQTERDLHDSEGLGDVSTFVCAMAECVALPVYCKSISVMHMRGGHRSLQGAGYTIIAIATSSNTFRCNSSTLPPPDSSAGVPINLIVTSSASVISCNAKAAPDEAGRDDAVPTRVRSRGNASYSAPLYGTGEDSCRGYPLPDPVRHASPRAAPAAGACADGEVIYVPRGYSKTQRRADFRWNRTHERWRQW